jgi:hypothetical protein
MSMRKIQHHAIIFLLFAILFSGLIYFPTKQTFAQLQSSTPTTSAQAGQSQLQPQQPSQIQDKLETSSEPSLLASVQPPTPQVAIAPPTSNQQRLQVSFISIRINNDHDPNVFGAQNDGEWKIGALVNGQFRDLSPPGSPLGDARGGRTYSLANMQPVVLNVDKSKGALVISTIGQEIDGCNFNFKIPPSLIAAGLAVAAIYTGGATVPAALSAASAPAKAQAYQAAIKGAEGVINKFCAKFNANDAIGTISDTFGPSTFGIGQHSTLSTPASDSGRDFVLTYQIKPVQGLLQSQVQQQTGQFPQTSNTIKDNE